MMCLCRKWILLFFSDLAGVGERGATVLYFVWYKPMSTWEMWTNLASSLLAQLQSNYGIVFKISLIIIYNNC